MGLGVGTRWMGRRDGGQRGWRLPKGRRLVPCHGPPEPCIGPGPLPQPQTNRQSNHPTTQLPTAQPRTYLDVLDLEALDVQVVQPKQRDRVPDLEACSGGGGVWDGGWVGGCSVVGNPPAASPSMV